jgi:chaperonin GroES
MNLKPLFNRMIILPLDQGREVKTASGLITLRDEIPPSTRGKVISIGPKVSNDVKVGDIVQYGQHSGAPLPWEGEDYLIMRETELICIL